MGQPIPFWQVVEAADQLSANEQDALIDILRRRSVDRGRKELAASAKEAREEFARGECKPCTPDELMRELLQ
jgi:hypothetical protein